MKIKNIPYNFVVIPTIGDGSCLLHAILGCCNKKYKESNDNEKRHIVRQLRHDLAELLEVKVNDTTFYQTLSRGQIEEISEHIEDVKIDHMKSYLKSNKWLNYTFIEYFSTVFDVNIIFISNNKIYRLGDEELLIKKRDTIFIHYIDQCHFESLGINTPLGIKTLFHFDNNIMKYFIQK